MSLITEYFNQLLYDHARMRARTHTRTHLMAFSGTIQVSQYQKYKTNLDFTEARQIEGSGISWAVCKSAPCSIIKFFYRPHVLPATKPTASKH